MGDNAWPLPEKSSVSLPEITAGELEEGMEAANEVTGVSIRNRQLNTRGKSLLNLIGNMPPMYCNIFVIFRRRMKFFYNNNPFFYEFQDVGKRFLKNL